VRERSAIRFRIGPDEGVMVILYTSCSSAGLVRGIAIGRVSTDLFGLELLNVWM
jgi:hypothetical protein